MRFEKQDKIRESEVEEALASNLFLLKRILNLEFDIRLIARQLILGSGNRLDLLLLHGKELALVELKVTRFDNEYVKQITGYQNEILGLQRENALVQGPIKSFLLLTAYTEKDKQLCDSSGIHVVDYEPAEILKEYFRSLAAVAPFLKIKPNDYGVFNIGLMNRVLNKLAGGTSNDRLLAKATGLKRGSVNNHLRVAREFGLARERNRQHFLTDLGDKFVANGDPSILGVSITEAQAEILKRFVANDPFYSSVVFGIYSIVESAFIISRSSYPVEFEELKSMFRLVGGKVHEWKARKSLQTATYSFLNFAIDLGLLGKIGKQVLITPAGFRFILMLQLHKSIEMIESLSQEVPATSISN